MQKNSYWVLGLDKQIMFFIVLGFRLLYSLSNTHRDTDRSTETQLDTDFSCIDIATGYLETS